MIDDNSTAQLPAGGDFQLALGTVMQGRYRIEGILGKGGMGHVYLVRDEHFAGTQAPPLRSMKEMIPRFGEAQKRMINFTREAMVLESLRHPLIPRVYDSFSQSNRAYLVLEYVEGRDLEQVLEKHPGLMPPQFVCDWTFQLIDTVCYLHSQTPPVIFRDLKPSNVILTPDGRIVLIDFGIAKTFAPETPGTNVGTPGYAAPEQYRGMAEVRSDVYSIGAMMHHLLTGQDPRHLTPFSFAERPIRRYNPAVPPELDALVMRCLQYDAEDRYQSIFELRDALDQVMDRMGVRRAARVMTGAPSVSAISTAAAPARTRTPRLRWRFETEEEVRSTPVVHNGTVYVGSYDYSLHAIDIATGRSRWKFATEAGICSSPAIWQNMVIFGSEDFNVYAVDAAQGTDIWRYRTWNHVRSSPCIVDGKVYIGSDDGHMHAIDTRNGTSLWRFRTYREVRATPAVGNGMVFFGSGDEYMYAVDMLTGERRWRFKTQGAIISSAAFAENYVYFGSMDFGVYSAEAKSGWQAWREPTDEFVISNPAVQGDRLYIGSTDHHLYCFDRRTGIRLWRFKADQQVNGTPVIYKGVVFFGCIDSYLYAVDANSGQEIWRYKTADMICGSPCVHDGIIYFGSSDGSVYALEANV
jgi:outer membrane protein assembly factor BamB/predicted Ser/Thr protein kinase